MKFLSPAVLYHTLPQLIRAYPKLSQTQLDRASFKHTIAKFFRISPELSFAQLCSTELSGTQLWSTELRRTQFRPAKFRSAQLGPAKLSGTQLGPAKLHAPKLSPVERIALLLRPGADTRHFPAFSSLDVNYFHITQPTFTGTTERIGIPPGTNPYFPPFSIYDDTPAQLYMFKAVNHRAFLYAPVTGTYTITVPDSDEITLVWLGDKAISTWTRANADLEQDFNTVDGPEETTVFRIELQAGTYTPFRLLWANAQGELSFIARVQEPGGRIIVDGDGSDSDFFVRFACDMSTPEYPPFGQDG
ncbi:hypothetical protein D7B24_009337 [Verticillium nonalfalfae]|uniref:PA14 domain-containing protein n=1 Tax=Verticillium nonalfalfae TaxID=1051616 RepID=A0A3M9Y4E5_9PEZI|nr:uncharacterized protein D7B24_009337 [Verticillium nonalfalfae]RNJ54872.1 hypothetical protein D7B24_009337 [Verticillium nonalfalfae]